MLRKLINLKHPWLSVAVVPAFGDRLGLPRIPCADELADVLHADASSASDAMLRALDVAQVVLVTA